MAAWLGQRADERETSHLIEFAGPDPSQPEIIVQSLAAQRDASRPRTHRRFRGSRDTIGHPLSQPSQGDLGTARLEQLERSGFTPMATQRASIQD